ncbi:hypothetical protein HDU82_000330 [Entophlyctis luteolus]|nr:hypothetical protein HDU82_000330 [Entophlyctis luteolus]
MLRSTTDKPQQPKTNPQKKLPPLAPTPTGIVQNFAQQQRSSKSDTARSAKSSPLRRSSGPIAPASASKDLHRLASNTQSKTTYTSRTVSANDRPSKADREKTEPKQNTSFVATSSSRSAESIRNTSNRSARVTPADVRVPSDNARRVEMELVIASNIPHPLMQAFSAQERVNHMMASTHIRLHRRELDSLVGIATFAKITHLYVQHNKIADLSPLASLNRLRVLAASHNHVQHISGISSLSELKLLDLSDNEIESVEGSSFPKSLENVSLAGNPCAAAPDMRLILASALPHVVVIDGADVEQHERRLAKIESFRRKISGRGADELDQIAVEDVNTEEDSQDSEDIVGSDNDIGSSPDTEEKSTSFESVVEGILSRSKTRQANIESEAKIRMHLLAEQAKNLVSQRPKHLLGQIKLQPES